MAWGQDNGLLNALPVRWQRMEDVRVHPCSCESRERLYHMCTDKGTQCNCSPNAYLDVGCPKPLYDRADLQSIVGKLSTGNSLPRKTAEDVSAEH